MGTGNPLFPSGSPTPVMDGRSPIYVEHGADPREGSGFDAPPFSVLRFGSEYFIKCGYEPTDWDLPPCALGQFNYLFANPPVLPHTYQDGSGFTGPLVLVFDAIVNPATVVLGASLLLTGSAVEGFGTITHETIANTIVLHNDIGGGDDWASEGIMDITMLPSILQLGTGYPLRQPATDRFQWISA
jgi:hypothetical protein